MPISFKFFSLTRTIVLGTSICANYWQSGDCDNLSGAKAETKSPALNSTSDSRKIPTTGADALNEPILENKIYSKVFLESQIRIASALIAANPKNYQAYSLRGLCYWKLEHFRQAAIDLDAAATLAPKKMTSSDYRALGECCVQNGLPEKAIASFSRAIQIYPRVQQYYLRRAQTYAQVKDFARAIGDADQVVKLTPKEAWTYEFRAKLKYSVGQYKNVVEDCTRAITLLSNVPSTYALRADAYEKLGQMTLAENDRKRNKELCGSYF
jgi:tetratricopeptide (TPR) repeat protein